MNYNAYCLESSHIPSYASSSFDGIKSTSGSVSALEGATVKSTTITKTETVTIKAEEKKEEEEKKEQQPATEESAAVEKKEQEPVEAEAVAED